MKKVRFSRQILNAAPSLKVLQIEADVVNSPTSDCLWEEIESSCDRLVCKYRLEDIKLRPGIAATRHAYKTLGKEPNRYRPSSEALCRRIINGKGIYRLTTIIDVINLISIETGYSIGGFDLDKIEGDSLILDAGNKEDSFHAIGRELLNVESLPLYRDRIGGIGTPTSDEERTKLELSTRRLLMLVNIYGEEMDVEKTGILIKEKLTKYASANNYNSRLIVAADYPAD